MRGRKKVSTIPNALLKRYGKPVRSTPVRCPIEGASGPCRVYVKGGVPSGEVLQPPPGRLRRVFYRLLGKPVIKVKKRVTGK